MPELFLHADDIHKIRQELNNSDKRKPRGMLQGTWKRLKTGDPNLLRLSMSDLRSLAILKPEIYTKLGLLRPEIFPEGNGVEND